ncbi:hypothetical protein FJT64_027420 [Amphibalanus amphitrite]|uniref:Uncharacterized protein n=1 Tax=Amphibalanus amphitrite TaxID=1232801 RepID=A0A6A4WDE7_AMPAM|nr:uncharacterized protein LOC122374743 [Amphibalanus amphitrite]KAF0299971.1 hypothetical protein FJT64_027420 [Amphibalanus amphitrite]
MLAMIVQSILKSLSGMTCLGVILADASALSGILMGYNIVKETELKDPIMTVIFGNLLLSATFVDIFNQGIGLIFALCYEMKWMLRIYMALLLAVLFIRFSIVCKPPVTGLKSAPFLGRPWTSSNTPYAQMDQDIISYYSRAPSQSLYSSLATFEVKLRCCGVNAPTDYSAKFTTPQTCLPGATLPTDSAVAGNGTAPESAAPGGGNGTAPATNSSSRLEATTAAPAAATTAPASGKNDSSPAGPGAAAAGGGASVDRPGCRPRVWSLFEGSKVAFDATVSAMTFGIMTALLTVAWCELWGEGLISGIECCQETEKTSRKAS